MRDRIFYISCFGFLVGVLLRSLVFVNIYLVILFGVISLALVLFFSLISLGHSQTGEAQAKWGILFSVFILAFSLGIFRFHMVDVPNPAVFESQVGQKVVLIGQIVDEPSIKENGQQLTVEVAPQGLALGSLKARPFPAPILNYLLCPLPVRKLFWEKSSVFE